MDEVLVSFLRLAKKNQVIVAIRVGTRLMALLRDVDFATDDRVHALTRSFVIKLNSTEQVAVIGHRDSGHILPLDNLDQLLDIAGAV